MNGAQNGRRGCQPAERIHRDDGFRGYLSQRNTQPSIGILAPRPLAAQRSNVRDNLYCSQFACDLHKAIYRLGETNDERDSGRLQFGCGFTETIHHESVVPSVRRGVRRIEAKVDDNRRAHCISAPDRFVQGRVVVGALGGLHPVDHATPVAGRLGSHLLMKSSTSARLFGSSRKQPLR